MGIGKMVFPLYLKKLPDNMKFTVTEIRAIDPPSGGSWYKYNVCLLMSSERLNLVRKY